jgi:two-component system alkaline phosphatase synthesis response regulator PhoP
MRILVVDDDVAIVEVLSVGLSRAGYEVVPAYSGSEALSCACCMSLAGAIVDMRLPDPALDGVEVVRQLRQQPHLATVPIVLLTAHIIAEEDMQLGLAAGANAYMLKPFRIQELREQLRALLIASTMCHESDHDA